MNATTTTATPMAAAATTATAARATARTTATTIRSVAELDHHGARSHEVYAAGFYPSSWDYVVRMLLGKSYRGGADAGEVLATIAAVAPEDRAGWFAAWKALGERLGAVAKTCAEGGHRVSAARTYLRAANYLGVALNSIDGLDSTDPLLPTFRAHRAAWENFVDHTHWPVQRVEIPYQDTTMPGWLFQPDTSTKVRRTLVVNNGSDGATSGLWCEAAEGGLERGYNVLLFDGPGQQSLLFERNIPFRYDWEKVLTPVVDFLLARDDVDADRLAVYGISQAGYWVPRALAFEHRFAAAIADGGVVDISRTWFANLPPALLSLYQKGETDQFDQALTAGMTAPGARAAQETWQFRARPYGVTGYSAVLDAVSRYNLTDVAGQIRTPLYITAPDGEQLLPGQSAELAQLVPGSTLVSFTEEEGATYHCQPMARALTEQRMFDWLDEQLS